MKQVLILLALCCPLAAVADCATNWMECAADSSLQIGSFDMHASEVIDSITASRVRAVHQLQHKKITGDQAQLAQAKADHARTLWEQARAACHSDVTGNCDTPSDAVKAFALLASSRKALK